jgi:hypothetical protein
MKRAAFLFGSGISYASDAPTLDRITDAILSQGWYESDYPNSFSFLVHSALLLIHWAVFDKLWPIQRPKGIEVLSSVANTAQQTDIFSLNHDLLIERQLEQSGIVFSDGFSQKIGDVLRFNGSWKDEDSVRLYKLHGSLDWYPFAFPDGIHQFAKLIRTTDPYDCKDNDGNYLSPQNSVPLFLTGTIGKDRRYTIGFVGELFRRFHARLGSHRTLICCGYGWKDKGINNYLTQWLHDAHKKRVVILHGGSLDTLNGTRFWSSKWANDERDGKLVVVSKWLSDCGVEDLEPFFEN